LGFSSAGAVLPVAGFPSVFLGSGLEGSVVRDAVVERGEVGRVPRRVVLVVRLAVVAGFVAVVVFPVVVSSEVF